MINPLDPLDSYPITIRTARYGGQYAGGPWILVAGVPFDATDATAGDHPCHRFWIRVDHQGPVVEVSDSHSDRSAAAYVASGDDPNGLLSEMEAYFEEYGGDDE